MASNVNLLSIQPQNDLTNPPLADSGDAQLSRSAADPDSIERGAHREQAVDGLRVARDRADDAEAIVSTSAKGIAANKALPQKYRLKPVTPELDRKRTTNALINDMTRGKVKAPNEKPNGLWVVRTDAPHPDAPTHHVNVNRKATGLEDPHIPISETAYKASGSAARVLEGAEKVAVPIAVGIDAARLGDAIVKDGGRVGKDTAHAAASVAGGWAGAAAGGVVGAEGGAAIGGGIGALFGGVGAVPGAAIGGVVGGIGGGIAGAMGGSWAAEKAADSAMKR